MRRSTSAGSSSGATHSAPDSVLTACSAGARTSTSTGGAREGSACQCTSAGTSIDSTSSKCRASHDARPATSTGGRVGAALFDARAHRAHRAGGRRQHRHRDFTLHRRCSARQAELRERDRIAIGGNALRGVGHEAVVRRDVAAVQRVQRALGEDGVEFRARRELGRHRGERRPERGDQPDAPACAHRVVDHRLVRLLHRHVRPAAPDRIDAGAERGTREENSRRPGAQRVVGERDEAFAHAPVEGAGTREIRRQAVVQQVHPQRLRPRALELRVDRRDRMGQRVDQRDPVRHASGVRRARAACACAAPATTRRTRPARTRAGRTSAAWPGRTAPRRARCPSPARSPTSSRASRT